MMKMDRKLLETKTPSLEEGPMKYHNSNEYFVLNETYRKTKCSRFFAILKVILYIELIIFVGWLGCVSLSQYNCDQGSHKVESLSSSKCQLGADGCPDLSNVAGVDDENIGLNSRREVRSVDPAVSAREKCERSVDATRRRVDNLAAQMVSGDPSDPQIVKLRHRFVHMMVSLTLRVIFVQSNDTTNPSGPTDEEWRTLTLEMEQEIVKSADSEHKLRLTSHGPPSQEITDEIRDTVEAMVRDYMSCETILPTPKSGNSKGTTQQALHLVEIIIERERCANMWNATQERIRALEARVVPGDASDPIVTKLRREAGEMLVAIPQALALFIRDDEKTKGALANITNVHWHSVLLDVKEEISNSTDLQHQQNLRAAGPPSQEMTNELQAIVEYFLIDHRRCNRLQETMLSTAKSKRKNYQASRRTRAIRRGIISYFDEEENPDLNQDQRARLEAFGEEKSAEQVDSPRERESSEKFKGAGEDGIPMKGEHPVEKRSVAEDPTPETMTETCWNAEQDSVLLEERLERLEARAIREDAAGRIRDVLEQEFFGQLGAALNASSISEIHFSDEFTGPRKVFSNVLYLTSNSSLEMHKEGFELMRDLILELSKLNDDNSPEWEGVNLSRLGANLTDSMAYLGTGKTPESVFNDFVRIGTSFNLQYVESERNEDGSEPRKPALGKFTYLGEEAEKLGIRHVRHILDGFAKLYFKTQDSTRPGICKSNAVSTNEHPIEKRFVTAEPPRSIVGSCWGLMRDSELVEERRARLEAFTERNATGSPQNQYTEDYMNAIDRALKATSVSEIHFPDSMLESSSALLDIQNLVANSSLELAKEGYEFMRDLYLEMLELRDGSAEWEGYTVETVAANISGGAILFAEGMDSASIFRDFVRFGQIFNLRYDELQKRQNGDESNKPLFGKFVYLGEEPEKLGVRHLRRILDDFVKLYFRIENPSEWAICDPAVESNVGEDGAETPNKDKRSL